MRLLRSLPLNDIFERELFGTSSFDSATTSAVSTQRRSSQWREAWRSRGYPAISWSVLEDRFLGHGGHVRRLMNDKNGFLPEFLDIVDVERVEEPNREHVVGVVGASTGFRT